MGSPSGADQSLSGAEQWRQPAGIIAVAALLSFGAAPFSPWGGFAGDVAGALAVAGILVGVARHRPAASRAWRLLAGGIACWVAGDVVWDVLAVRGMDPGSYHHLADLLYLVGYPLLGAGIFELVRARSPDRDRSGLLDGAILATAGVIVVWAFLIAPQGTGGSILDQFLLAAYPLADGLLLAGIAWLALTPGRPCAALWLLGGALTLVFVIDLLWDIAARFAIEGMDPWLNPWYAISYALLAAAALHPSVRALTERGRSPDHRVHPGRLVFLGIALFAGPLVAVAQNGEFGTRDLMVSGCSLAVAGLVIARLLGLVRENERAERRFRLMAENVPVGIYEVGDELCISFANAEADRLFGEEVEHRAAPELLALVDVEDRQKMVEAAEAVLAGRPAEVEFRLRAADGALRWVRWRGIPGSGDRSGAPTAFASTEDITDLVQAQQALERQATHDPLTGLPNRRLLSDRLELALDRLRRHSATLAVMFVDLDRFKMVNDVMGHDAGDALLVDIGRRIDATVRASDTVARIGGDEFVVLCEDAGSRDDLAQLATKLIAAVETGPMDVGASVGIARATGRDDNAEALLRDADAAMYRAKANGRGRYEFFEPTGDAPVAGAERRLLPN